MITSPSSSSAATSARRFIGRKASLCRKHGDHNQQHYVNRMGGLVCAACNPPRTEADCVLRLVIRGGVWDDAENPFDEFEGDRNRQDALNQPETVVRSGTTAPHTGSGPQDVSASSPATNFDETTTSELATPRPTRRRVGEPLLDLELDFYFNLPSELDGKWLGPEVISAKQFEEMSKEVREEGTGLLELGVQKSETEGGFVRPGTGADVSHNNELAVKAEPQFAVGQVVRLLRRLSTFRGVVSAGDGYVVSSAGVDSHGETVVALSRGGVVLVSGLVSDPETLAACEQIPIDDLLG